MGRPKAAVLAALFVIATVLTGSQAAQAAPAVLHASFDNLSESFHAPTLTVGGITFSGLDPRIAGVSPGTNFTIDATTDLAGFPGFTPPNVLDFGGFVPGPGIGFGRMGQFDMTTGGLETAATVNVFGPGNQPPNLLTLEALRNGGVVARASTRLSGRHLIDSRSELLL